MISDNLQHLVRPIEGLYSLHHNPNVGKVEAVMESYKTFGQLKPLIAVDNEQAVDGELTIIAGNTQLEAAKRLGWKEIAVSVEPMSDKVAKMFALADNQTADLGTTNQDYLFEMLDEVNGVEEFDGLLDSLEWDDFAFASLETADQSRASTAENTGGDVGWEPPEVSTLPIDTPSAQPSLGTASVEDVISQGVTATGTEGTGHKIIQFTLAFDTPEQQSHWYAFLRWIREQPSYDGETTSELLLDFIGQHSDCW